MLFTINGVAKEFLINHLVVAGWTARDQHAVQEHIDELAELGVAPPSTVPLYYRASNLLLTQQPMVEVVGGDSSGEVEPLIIKAEDGFWLGLGSDHTDRELEAHSVAFSKQVCPKPVATELWPLAEVEDHLDQIEMQSWVDEGEGWTLYQSGKLAAIRPLSELIEKAKLENGSAMLCGTFAAIGGVRNTPKFRMALHDPVLNRSIQADYQTRELPAVK
ncbi:DUF2848 domain-containing protein [Marinomonas dokdonensis]|uniref:DUF2848 domain-containing protein n=1 Tax=Marinomonas dokdonensis TaxID=328224 RepID=UPI00405565AE